MSTAASTCGPTDCARPGSHAQNYAQCRRPLLAAVDSNTEEIPASRHVLGVFSRTLDRQSCPLDARWVPCAPAPQLAVAGPEVQPYPAVVHAASESTARGKALRDVRALFCSHCSCAWLAHQKGARTTSTGPNTPHSSATLGAPILDPRHSSGRCVGVARPGALQVAGLSWARRPCYHCVEVLQRRQAAIATKVGKTQMLRCKKRWTQGRYPRSSSHN